MTIKNTFTFFEENEKEPLDYDDSINQKRGLTKEQLLFKNLKEIANSYLKTAVSDATKSPKRA